MILALVVFLAMFPMDISAAAKVSFLERHKPWMAGHMEVINDWGGALSYGIGGSALLRYGFSFTTLAIFVALGFASELGTVTGYRLTNRRPR